MLIKVIQQKSTGKYVSGICIEYPPYTGWWYLTDDLSKALVVRNQHQGMWLVRWMRHLSDYEFVYKEFTNLCG